MSKESRQHGYPLARGPHRADPPGPENQCGMNVSAASRRKGVPLTPAEERRIYNRRPWYTVVDFPSRLEGGLLGLLTGDAVGVPYEFSDARVLPRIDYIQMDPPEGFRRHHASAPRHAWSDDGAQALCLLESLLEHDRLDPDDFAQRLVRWHRQGHMAVEGVVFDVGIQTSEVLREIERGVPWRDAVPVQDETKNGNGALMRVLPLALWHCGPDEELVVGACLQSRVTHGHLRSQIACALYCLWARRLLLGSEDAYTEATDKLYEVLREDTAALRELDRHIRPREEIPCQGSGYVVDSLHSVRAAMREQSYERVVQRAIAFGNDTDTTAALAGGLAGLRDGVDAIPSSWRLHEDGLRIVRSLADQLLSHRGVGRTMEWL